MMRLARLGALLFATLLAVACQSGGSGSGATVSGPKPAGLCRGLDADGRELHDKLVHIATASDSFALRARATAHLQQMPADSVILVNDATICEQAAAAVTKIRGIPASQYRSINVFRLGPVYVVNRPDGHSGLDAWVLDQNLKVLFGWML